MYGGRCQRCGEYPREAMYGLSSFTYHHIDPAKKKKPPHDAVSQLDFEELDKCCLLCANCHFLLKGEIEAAFIPRAGGRGYTVKEWWWTEDSWFYDGQRRRPGVGG